MPQPVYLPDRAEPRSVTTTLTGTTPVTLVPAPQIDEIYVVIEIGGRNESGATRILNIVLDKGGTDYYVSRVAALAFLSWFHGTASSYVGITPIILDATDEKLEVSLDAAGTYPIVAYYYVVQKTKF